MSKFTQALGYLLPRGYAWPQATGSTLQKLVSGFARAYEEFHAFVDQAYREWLPTRTQQRLGEWEEALGLPDPWTPPGGSLAVRRTRVLARLRGTELPYIDSSPASPGVIEAKCLALGYSVNVSYRIPARCKVTRCGGRFGALDGVLIISMAGPGPAPDELVGFLNRIVPARFSWQFLYT